MNHLSLKSLTCRTLCAAGIVSLTLATAAWSAEWEPTKPVRMIVGFPPGGATDLVARILQPKLSATLGKQIVVDNRPGANGVISVDIISRSEPDGHTVGFGHIGTLVISPAIQMSHVPYKGGGPAITDLIAGHVPSFFAVISTAVPHVQSGKARGIAVTGIKRAEALPQVPTVAESGVPGYAATNWYGLLAPAKTPKAVIDRLNKELVAALKSPDVIQQLKDRGIDAAPGSPAEFTKFVREEEKKWVPIIKRSNIKE